MIKKIFIVLYVAFFFLVGCMTGSTYAQSRRPKKRSRQTVIQKACAPSAILVSVTQLEGDGRQAQFKFNCSSGVTDGCSGCLYQYLRKWKYDPTVGSYRWVIIDSLCSPIPPQACGDQSWATATLTNPAGNYGPGAYKWYATIYPGSCFTLGDPLATTGPVDIFIGN